MLKQILQDMRIDAEILNGLNETEKQTLFCIMREEQIRRWRIWDQEQQSNDKSSNKLNKKTVKFMQGEDGEPWVWVMGEHSNDKSIEQILAEEAQQKARQLAEQEAKELRKSVEAELSEIIEYDQQKQKKIIPDDDDLRTPKIDEMEIYCSVDELRERIANNNINNGNKNNNNNKTVSSPNIKQLQNMYNSRTSGNNYNSGNGEKRDILQEISLNKTPQKVATRVALWETRMIGERTCEILRGMQKKQQETVKEAEEAAKKQEELWKEQERKAKQAEIKIREIARRAREEHRKSLNCDQLDINDANNTTNNGNDVITSPPSSLDPTVPRPPNQEAVVKWYREEELPKCAGLELNSRPSKWFHGLLTRAEAENLLLSEPAGTFLVRISEKIWGYAISYKDNERCKHYLVDASSGRYQFLGANQLSHTSLNDLIKFHANTPITLLGNELLRTPCPSNSGVIPDILK